VLCGASYGPDCALRSDEFWAAYVADGSARASQAVELTAGKLTSKLIQRMEDISGQR